MSKKPGPPDGERGTASPAPAHPVTGGPADPESAHPGGRRYLNPRMLAYLMGPAALGALLLLMRFGEAARESAWLWLAIFITIPLLSVGGDRLYDARPSQGRLHLRIAIQAAAVTAVIYLSGWGPVLWGAYAFLALENVARSGSRVWRITALWSLVGIGLGQVAMWQQVVPVVPLAGPGRRPGPHGRLRPHLRHPDGRGHHGAEGAGRGHHPAVSEDRFRSLIQNSSDATMVLGADGGVHLRQPGHHRPARARARRSASGSDPPSSSIPRTASGSTARLGSDLADSSDHVLVQFRMLRRDGGLAGRRGRGQQPARPPLGERLRGQHPRHHRAQGVRGPPGPPGPPRPPDRPAQPPVDPRPRRADAGPVATVGPAGGRLLHRPRQLQGRQRLAGPRGRRPAAAGRGRPVRRPCSGPSDTRGPARRRRVRGPGRGGLPRSRARDDRRADQGDPPPALRDRRATTTSRSPSRPASASPPATGRRPRSCSATPTSPSTGPRPRAGTARSSSSSTMQTAAVDRLELKADLRAALAADQFFLLYQPIFDLDDVSIRGVEALLRWQHPTRGVISPDRLHPRARGDRPHRRRGPLGAPRGLPPGRPVAPAGPCPAMSVNVSMRQLESTPSSTTCPRPWPPRPRSRHAHPRDHRVHV